MTALKIVEIGLSLKMGRIPLPYDGIPVSSDPEICIQDTRILPKWQILTIPYGKLSQFISKTLLSVAYIR